MARKVQINVSELERSHATKVVDKYDDSKYLVVGKWGLVSDSYSIYSIAGEVLSEIKQKSLGTSPQFEIWYDDALVGSSMVNFSLHFSTIYIKGLNWLVVGNDVKQNYVIYSGRKRVGSINSYNTHNDVVRIVSANEIDEEPILVSIAAILNHPVAADQLNISKNPFKNFTPSLD
ncbi:hypothetical protein PL11_008035 [Lentilactobacillus curieae]|uniref:Uncharacterized protein n=1 Tax=Lentilactobacillus curieae TaxID=1138822 RepID=A0A1S6QJR7_9LACO|nr:hypothetical protein [Lentilactobacillus curieae]AQW21868.1 hypothetical protein PL11_008035 [Lentilactobacillus curieae]